MSVRRAAIDLRTHLGARYRIRREAGGETWYDALKDDRLWLLEVPCRYGIVYPQGGELLAAWTGHPRIGSKLRTLPCVVGARGDVETVVTFHVDAAEAVFRMLKPYRRRRLSEVQRTRKAEILARARLQRHRESLSQSDFPAPGSTPPSPDKAVFALGPEITSDGTEVAPDQERSQHPDHGRSMWTG